MKVAARVKVKVKARVGATTRVKVRVRVPFRVRFSVGARARFLSKNSCIVAAKAYPSIAPLLPLTRTQSD